MEFGNADFPDEKSLWFNLQTFTYNAIYNWAERSSWRTSIGVNGMSQRNENKGMEVLIPEYRLFDFGWFLYSQKNWEKVSLSGGLRFDNRSMNADQLLDSTGIKFQSFKKEFSNASGSIGISYQPSALVTLKFNVARGFRTPNIPELASNGKHEGVNRYEYGNLDLKSETSFQADAGLELNSEHLSLEASVFYNRINNFIFYRKLESVGGGDSTIEIDGHLIPAFQFDQHLATLTGLELVLDIHPHPLDWLHFENTFSFVRGLFSEPIEGTKNIPAIPATRLISQLGGTFYKEGKSIRNLIVRLELDANLSQNKAFTAFNTETATPGYTLFNATIGAEVQAHKKTLFSIYLNALNITDGAYQNHLSRLKYTAENAVTGRMGVFNMGRNFSIKVNVPINGKLREG